MLSHLIKLNRSYRRFDATHSVKREELIELLELARLSPSAMNRQPIRYRLISEPEECDFVFSNSRWGSYLKDWSGPTPQQRPTAFFLLCLPLDAGTSQFIDVGIAAQTILLAATQKGLGGCMLASVQKEEVHRHFRLPADLQLVLAIAIGKPAEKVVLETMKDPEAIEYWRDENDVHHVPKRPLEDLILP